jgi:hypothetical protein
MMRGYGAARTFLDRQNVDYKIKLVEGANVVMAIRSSPMRGRHLFDRLPYRVALFGGWESQEAARADIEAADLAALVFFEARKEAAQRIAEIAVSFKSLCGKGSTRKMQDEGMALASQLLGGTDLETSAVQPSRNAALNDDTKEFQKSLGLIGEKAACGAQQKRHNTIRVIAKVNELYLVAKDFADENHYMPEPQGLLPEYFIAGCATGQHKLLT